MEEFYLSIASMRPASALLFASAASPVDFTPSLFDSPPPTPAQDVTSNVDEEMQEALEQVQFVIGYSFSNLSLLEEALTHSSHPSRISYQRLEFVGDAVLNLAFTNFVYLTNPSVGPGALSLLRAANISTEKLARVAVRHDFYRYLRRNSPSLDLMVQEFSEAVRKEKEEDYAGISYGGSMVKAPKVLADIVESIAAAIYIDCSFNLVEFWKVFRGILEPIITVETPNQQPVSHIYELCQKQGLSIEFKNWKKENINITNVYVDGELLGVGSSEQKPIAKLNAARDALQKLCHDEADRMDIAKCSSQSSRTLEDVATSTQMNGGLVTGKADANGGEEVDGSKQRLHDLCSKKRWQKPVYRYVITLFRQCLIGA
ncbi:ribonuclease 3-like protein 2 [Phalaenopsis equestris]|uniref:ribonuclease 3-like protein 2 n=1 Tax=Phalaenopsis equestris TaxID=78828 RepID=UPI0009E5877E|nr:ribonuclease 3-like protein 2 [Phalaenopsis equestris]